MSINKISVNENDTSTKVSQYLTGREKDPSILLSKNTEPAQRCAYFYLEN